MTNSRSPLLSDFDKHTKEQWQAQIEKELKGKPFEDLIYKSEDDISTFPFYYTSDENRFIWKNESGNNWLVSEKINVTHAKEANKQALHALMNGANALWFTGNIEEQELPDLLNGIELQYIHLTLEPLANLASFKEAFQIYLSGKKLEKADCKGGIAVDFLSQAATTGKKSTLNNSDFEACTVVCKGVNWRNAGASIVQELAIFLAEANEYLGLANSPETITQNITFSTGIGSSYFYEIAKLRAARLLWSNLISEYGSETSLFIHAENTSFNTAVFDKHNNLLRSTTEAMSAILGGCNSLSILPFDTATGETSTLGTRMARNIQSILLEESYFGNIADPAAGAYYIEHLTKEIAEKAWALFQNIESEGGYTKSLGSNQLQNMVEASYNQQKEAFENGEIIILGVNRFPNMQENATNYNKEEAPSPIKNGVDFKAIQAVRLTAEQEHERISNQK